MSSQTLISKGHQFPGGAAAGGEGMPSMPPLDGAPEVPLDETVYTRRGGWFLFLTFGIFSLWAAFAPLSSAIVGGGEVVVDSHRKSIQHYEGGIIRDILVHNGEHVESGEPLIKLETTQWEAELKSTRDRLYSAKAELERLIAEQGFEERLTFSKELQQEAQNNPDLQMVLGQQHQLHKARLEAYLQQRKAVESRIEQIKEQISGLHQQAEVLKEHIASLEEEEQAFAALFAEGLGDGQRSRELKRSILQMKNQLTGATSDAARLAIQVSEAESQLATQQQDYLKEVGERIKESQAEYFSLQEQLRVAEDRLRRATIRAPESGVIVDLQVHTIGGVAPSASTLLDLVPDEDTFVIEAKILPQDINDIYVGQKADIRFSAFNTRLTKVIEGEVTYVSADRLTNERDGTSYYLARLKITEQGYKDMKAGKVGMDLVAGMPAEVMIRGEDRTLFSYLLKPLTDFFARGMREY